MLVAAARLDPPAAEGAHWLTHAETVSWVDTMAGLSSREGKSWRIWDVLLSGSCRWHQEIDGDTRATLVEGNSELHQFTLYNCSSDLAKCLKISMPSPYSAGTMDALGLGWLCSSWHLLLMSIRGLLAIPVSVAQG